MSDDDIRVIFGKLDKLSEGQTEIRTNQVWVMQAQKDQAATLSRIDSGGCARGQQQETRIAALEGRPVANGNGSWFTWDGTKHILKVHGGIAILGVVVIIHMIYSEWRLKPQPEAGVKAYITRQVTQAVNDKEGNKE